MFKFYLIIATTYLVTIVAFSMPAHRPNGMSFQDLVGSHLSSGLAPNVLDERPSVYKARKNWNHQDLADWPSDFATYEELLDVFISIRDPFLFNYSERDRRISWLYPADGCWIRADVANRLVISKSHAPLRKVFVFGNLHANTQYASNGRVTWWYHVALVARVGSEVYVLDPAIEASGPLTLGDWVGRQGQDLERADISICTSQSFSPKSPCESTVDDDPSEEHVLEWQFKFLGLEWTSIESLGLNAEELLGASPPWKVLN